MIFSTVLLLSVKVSDIWNGVEGYVDVASAVAQTVGGEQPLPLTPTGTDQTGLDPDGVAPLSEEDVFDSELFLLEDDISEQAAEKMIADDPTLLSQTEIELLQRLAARRIELESRASELDQREVLLLAAEERINNKINQLKIFQESIDDLVVKYDEQQERKMQSLVKIYENMKPKDAARIFEELDMVTLLTVAERMKERKLSDIMAKMTPNKARDVTVELSQLRDLPEVDNASGG